MTLSAKSDEIGNTGQGEIDLNDFDRDARDAAHVADELGPARALTSNSTQFRNRRAQAHRDQFATSRSPAGQAAGSMNIRPPDLIAYAGDVASALDRPSTRSGSRASRCPSGDGGALESRSS